MDLLQSISASKDEILQVYHDLHLMPEKGFEEFKTSAYIQAKLEAAGFEVITNVNNTTGLIGILKGSEPGPVYAVRADMDALIFTVDDEDLNHHACGHDANSTIVLMAVLAIAKKGIQKGVLKVIFQPAEELLTGALTIIESGLLNDIDEMVGLHLRPIQEARMGEATAALCHGAAYVIDAVLTGLNAHGARPHLGINAIDAGAAVVQAVNAIKMNPMVPYSVKTTKFVAGGAASNIIPDKTVLVFDLRTQENEVMDELIEKTKRAILQGAATVGAGAEISIRGGVPAANHHQEVVERTTGAIVEALGQALDPIVTIGGEDFHFYSTKLGIKTAYIGLGADLIPGLHSLDMSFNLDALINGVKIVATAIDQRLNR